MAGAFRPDVDRGHSLFSGAPPERSEPLFITGRIPGFGLRRQ
jgi:hypothetical protein